MIRRVRVKRKGAGIDYLLLVEALGRIQGNLKLEIGEETATLTAMEIMSRQLLTLLHRNRAQPAGCFRGKNFEIRLGDIIF